MNILKLNLDYKLSFKEEVTDQDKDKSRAEITRLYIETATMAHFKTGLGRSERRTYASLHKKINDCIDNNTFEIKLDKLEIKMLREVFEDAKFPAGASEAVIVLEDAISLL